MGEFLQKASELFWRKPLLWLPVIVADLLGTAINQGQLAILKAMVIRRTEVHSALGGSVQHVALTREAVAQAAQAATPMVWLAYSLRITLYVVALVVTAAMVRSLLEPANKDISPVKALKTRKGGILSLTVRVLAVDAIGSVLIGWMSRALALHGHQNLVRSPWFHLGNSVVMMLVVSLLVAATALRMLVGAPVSDEGANRAVLLGALLALCSLALGFFAGNTIPSERLTSAVQQIAVATFASLLTALPFILMFIGFGVLAHDEQTASAVTEAEA